MRLTSPGLSKTFQQLTTASMWVVIIVWGLGVVSVIAFGTKFGVIGFLVAGAITWLATRNYLWTWAKPAYAVEVPPTNLGVFSFQGELIEDEVLKPGLHLRPVGHTLILVDNVPKDFELEIGAVRSSDNVELAGRIRFRLEISPAHIFSFVRAGQWPNVLRLFEGNAKRAIRQYLISVQWEQAKANRDELERALRTALEQARLSDGRALLASLGIVIKDIDTETLDVDRTSPTFRATEELEAAKKRRELKRLEAETRAQELSVIAKKFKIDTDGLTTQELTRLAAIVDKTVKLDIKDLRGIDIAGAIREAIREIRRRDSESGS